MAFFLNPDKEELGLLARKHAPPPLTVLLLFDSIEVLAVLVLDRSTAAKWPGSASRLRLGIKSVYAILLVRVSKIVQQA
jgi:hypothetical protein